MIRELIRAEFIKMRKNYLGVFLVTFNLLSILIGSVIFGANRSVFASDGNQSLVLWGQSSLYSSQLFFPILIGIICTISWQLEEKNKNWQRISALPIKSSKFIFSKFLSIQLLTGLNQIIFLLLFLISALVLKVQNVQISQFLLWTLFGWMGTFSIVALQLFISVKFRNFTFPILIAAMGSIFGLMTLFIGELMFHLFPYTQITIGVRARALSTFNFKELLVFLGITVFYSILFLLLTTREIRKREEV